MPECDADTSVPDWVIEHPETLVVFEELNIDTSCGGKSLAFACQQQGLDVSFVLSRLCQLIAIHRDEHQ
jgi:iron-sulfur cluster repair protein YtfE (RIC family)